MFFDIISNMKLFNIVKDNKRGLRERSTPVIDITSKEKEELLLSMIEYLKSSQDPEWAEKNKVRAGVGLAAPQIGLNEDMMAIYFKDEEEKIHQYGFINPQVISESVKMAYLEGGEGCLSVDKEHPGYVYRNYKVTMKGYNVVTKRNETHTFTGYEAIVFEHEYDHLKGILFYDRIDKKDPFKKLPDAISI
jgi:peptide deformylase